MKSKIDKLDIGKLETTPVGLSKLSNAVKLMSLKRLNISNQLKRLTILILLILAISIKKTDYNIKISKIKNKPGSW